MEPVEAGCPSGQRERSVKPSAQPTLVRTQHLPPLAEKPSDWDNPVRSCSWRAPDAALGVPVRVALANTCRRVCSAATLNRCTVEIPVRSNCEGG